MSRLHKTSQGRIRLLRKVGRGASATVWAAHHEGLGRVVAVKRVSARRLRDRPDEDARLAREAWIASRLRSPHAVEIHAHARRSEASYLVMEWLPGRTLEEHLRGGGPLELDRVEAVVRQVAALLSEAHGLGIVHRDIKPSNLLVTAESDRRPFVKVLDFGIAGLRSERSTEAPGKVLGSPLYMSPERFAGTAELDPRADLWSLAVVAYRALTGVHPFVGKTVADVAVAAHEGYPTPSSQLCPGLSAALDVWFARAFARDVACRFQTPASFAAAFTGAVRAGDEPTTGAIDVVWAAPESVDEGLEQTCRIASVPQSGVVKKPVPLRSTKPDLVGVA